MRLRMKKAVAPAETPVSREADCIVPNHVPDRKGHPCPRPRVAASLAGADVPAQTTGTAPQKLVPTKGLRLDYGTKVAVASTCGAPFFAEQGWRVPSARVALSHDQDEHVACSFAAKQRVGDADGSRWVARSLPACSAEFTPKSPGLAVCRASGRTHGPASQDRATPHVCITSKRYIARNPDVRRDAPYVTT